MDIDRNGYRELLRESAPIAHRLSASKCVNDLYGGAGCRWYHGAWQYFAILNAVATPWDQLSFFKSTMVDGNAAADPPRVLISGTADYAMLALLQHCFSRVCRPPEFTVIDLCDVPVAMNRWFAARAGLRIDARRTDILRFGRDSAFDVICTHSFFGNFTAAKRPALVAAWHRLLRPRGRVVTVARIRPGAGEDTRFTPEQAEVFIDRVASAASGLGKVADRSATEVTEMARAYTRFYRSFPVTSESDLRRMIEQGGFEIERFDTEGCSGRDAGPATAGGAARRLMVLRRR